jgi:hypothetical protein
VCCATVSGLSVTATCSPTCASGSYQLCTGTGASDCPTGEHCTTDLGFGVCNSLDAAAFGGSSSSGGASSSSSSSSGGDDGGSDGGDGGDAG